jgi:hypothetical protein
MSFPPMCTWNFRLLGRATHSKNSGSKATRAFLITVEQRVMTQDPTVSTNHTVKGPLPPGSVPGIVDLDPVSVGILQPDLLDTVGPGGDAHLFAPNIFVGNLVLLQHFNE